MLNICVPDTQTSIKTEFFVMPGTADTVLGRSSSEELGVLKVGVSVNASESKNTADKKAALKAKFPQVFTGLGKFQLKLNVDEGVTPPAQAMRRIPFSRKQKVVDKLEELEARRSQNLRSPHYFRKWHQRCRRYIFCTGQGWSCSRILSEDLFPDMPHEQTRISDSPSRPLLFADKNSHKRERVQYNDQFC